MGFWVDLQNSCETPEDNRSFLRRWWLTILAIGLILALGIIWLLASGGVTDYKSLGYPGAFVISFLAGATLIVPIPGLVVVFLLGGVLVPWVLGPVAGLGEALGEFTGYLAGRGGHDALKGRFAKSYGRVESLVERRGMLIIFIAAATPNPLFDLFGFAAGATKQSSWKFFLACWGGKTVKNTMLALLGMWGMGAVLRWFGVDV